MARVVRKVSGKAIRGQRKGLLYSSKFWISVAAAAVAILAIVLGLVFGLRGNSDKEVKVEDYFGMENKVTVVEKDQNGNEQRVEKPVKFTKSSYANILMHTNENFENEYIDYVFIFATDLSKFYPKDLMQGEDNLKNDDHAAIFEALMLLQYSIDQFNANDANKETEIALYIVDTQSHTGSDNGKILTNTKFGGNESGEISCLFSLMSKNEQIKEFEAASGKKKSLYTTELTKSSIQASVNNAQAYISEKLISKEEEKN